MVREGGQKTGESKGKGVWERGQEETVERKGRD